MILHVIRISNGWLVEIWRVKNGPKETHAFLDRETLMIFVAQTTADAD